MIGGGCCPYLRITKHFSRKQPYFGACKKLRGRRKAKGYEEKSLMITGFKYENYFAFKRIALKYTQKGLLSSRGKSVKALPRVNP